MEQGKNSSKSQAGYREIEHTADWELEVWSPNLVGLLVQAARGMHALANVNLEDMPVQTRTIEISGSDYEELLVDFLTEILYLTEDDRLGFEQIELTLNENTLFAVLNCRPIKSISKEIKAVTYHNLSINKTNEGFTTRIVFDV